MCRIIKYKFVLIGARLYATLAWESRGGGSGWALSVGMIAVLCVLKINESMKRVGSEQGVALDKHILMWGMMKQKLSNVRPET